MARRSMRQPNETAFPDRASWLARLTATVTATFPDESVQDETVTDNGPRSRTWADSPGWRAQNLQERARLPHDQDACPQTTVVARKIRLQGRGITQAAAWIVN